MEVIIKHVYKEGLKDLTNKIKRGVSSIIDEKEPIRKKAISILKQDKNASEDILNRTRKSLKQYKRYETDILIFLADIFEAMNEEVSIDIFPLKNKIQSPYPYVSFDSINHDNGVFYIECYLYSYKKNNKSDNNDDEKTSIDKLIDKLSDEQKEEIIQKLTNTEVKIKSLHDIVKQRNTKESYIKEANYGISKEIVLLKKLVFTSGKTYIDWKAQIKKVMEKYYDKSISVLNSILKTEF